MAKKYYDFKFDLEIDGQPIHAGKASPLFQRDPFPGGHKYSCVISGKRLGKYFYSMLRGGSERVAEGDAREYFSALGLSWVQNAVGLEGRPEYFLNSVEAIDFDGERLKFSGVCSPVVRD
jgi:hypothetical protein